MPEEREMRESLRGRLRRLSPRLFGLLRQVKTRVSKFRSPRLAFTEIYRRNLWGEGETRSGSGSALGSTRRLREALPELLGRLGAQSMLDAGCGDFNWLKEIDLGSVRYIGGDVVARLVAENAKRFARPGREFLVVDVTSDPLPRADLVLCRHCLIHLPNQLVLQALQRISESGARYLLATTSPAIDHNTDTTIGGFRLLNLQLPPFNLPAPMMLLEDLDDADSQGVLGLWRLTD